MACAPSEDRSAWAPAQSDQSLPCALSGLSIDPSFLHADSKDSGQTGRMAVADLSLRWAHMSFGRFCPALAHMFFYGEIRNG